MSKKRTKNKKTAKTISTKRISELITGGCELIESSIVGPLPNEPLRLSKEEALELLREHKLQKGSFRFTIKDVGTIDNNPNM